MSRFLPVVFLLGLLALPGWLLLKAAIGHETLRRTPISVEVQVTGGANLAHLVLGIDVLGIDGEPRVERRAPHSSQNAMNGPRQSAPFDAEGHATLVLPGPGRYSLRWCVAPGIDWIDGACDPPTDDRAALDVPLVVDEDGALEPHVIALSPARADELRALCGIRAPG